jgi:hypothetical protein
MRQIDYGEPVRIVWINDIDAKPVLRKAQVKCSLSEAVRRAVAKWADQPHEPVCLIVRDGGRKPLTTYKAVRKIYERPDFPKH